MTTSENPVVRHRRDFAAFAAENLKIQTKDARLVPFVLNRVQRRLWEVIQSAREAGKPVRLYVLKARQLGISTFTQGLAYWVTTLWPNRNALVVAHALDQSEMLFEKSRIFYVNAPRDFRPPRKLSNRKEMHFANPDPKGEPGLESRILVDTADNKNLGVSMTLHLLHLSEFARYEKIQQNVRATLPVLLQSVPEIPETYVILETTAQGLGYAKDFWDNENGFIKVFQSWVAEEQYRLEEPVAAEDLSDVEESEFGNELHALKYVLRELEFWYPEIDDEIARMREALCRLAWRRLKIRKDFQGDLNLFRQEYPLYAEEAFVTSGTSVFDTRKIHDVRSSLYERDADGRPLRLVVEPRRYRFDREIGKFYSADHGTLLAYEKPRRNGLYVLGADVAEGIGEGDWSVAQVLRLPDLAQVAVFRERLDPDDFADVIAQLGKLYNWAQVVVETNGAGFATNLKLTKTLFYPNLYWREVFDSLSKQYTKKSGWNSNKASKNVLVSDLRAAFRDDLIRFHDPHTLDEMSYFVQHDSGKLGAVPGENDDCVIALGLALQGAYRMGVSRLGKGHSLIENEAAPVDPRGVEGSFEWWAELAEKANKRARQLGARR